jgi:Fic family protein
MIRTESILITPEMLALVGEIDEFKGAWRALRKLAPERLLALRKVATIESVGSSTRIEGAQLSDRQVEALLARVRARSFATRDEQEVAGYAALMETIFENHAAIDITENYIKQLHGILLKHSAKDARHRGEYKKLPNNVQAFNAAGKLVGTVFETATPIETPRRMAELVQWAREALDAKKLHPMIAIGVFNVVFLAIHPFQDGNGRLSRALTTLLLQKSGYAYVPYSSMESIIEQSKESYYLALRQTQGTLRKRAPDWSGWLSFFLHTLQQQKRRLDAKVEREQLLAGTLPELAVAILELAADHGQVRVADIIAATGGARGTVKKRVTELVAAGHLRRGGQGRSTWYTLA